MTFFLCTLGFMSLGLAFANNFSYEPAYDNGEFPWFCTIYDNVSSKPFCYCTIVGPKVIVTAPACFQNRSVTNTKIHVRYGSIAANGMRKFSKVKKIVSSDDHFIILQAKSIIEGYDLIDLIPSKDDKVTIATFHSYGTTQPMKTHVHLVKAVVSNDLNCRGNYHQFCVSGTHKRCNIGLGAGAVSVSPRNSSRWILTGIAVQSPKCQELPQEKNLELTDIFIKIEEQKLPWIEFYMKN